MTVVRKNILTDDSARDDYIRGIKMLKDDFLNQDWPNTYDIFTIWHYVAMMTSTPENFSMGRNAAHSGPAFLPWHRLFLILLEHHIQRVISNPDFGLPYWDWAADGDLQEDEQSHAQIWSDEYMGGNGSPVTSGPFREGSWQINIESGIIPGSFSPRLFQTNRPLMRNIGSDATRGLPTTAEVRDIVHNEAPNSVYDSSPWLRGSDGFRNDLEGWPKTQQDGIQSHNLVHVWVGGDMGPATSPNDPVFYMNHCNVDRVWAAWQQVNPTSNYLPDDNADSSLEGHRLNDNLHTITNNPVFDPVFNGNVRPSDLLDVSSIYQYDSIQI